MKTTTEEMLIHLRTIKTILAEWFYEYYTGEEPSRELFGNTDYYWTGGGSTLGVCDIFVDLDDIVDIIENDIPLKAFMSWYSYRVEGFDNTKIGKDEFDTEIIDRVNLKSYASIRGSGTHEDYVAWHKEQERIKTTLEYKKQCEEDLKKIYDNAMLELKKYIPNP